MVEFDHFKSNAGLHTFVLSVSEWIENTSATGLFVKRGKYGGTYAHKDFASISDLTVLSNLETHNAQMVREGKCKTERFQILKEIAEYQLKVLSEAEHIKMLDGK